MKLSTLSSPMLAALLMTSLAPGHSAGFKAPEQTFEQAVEQYRNSRRSDAYGRFAALANRGDRDAARIALFMYRYGPILYGSYWDASTEEVETWEQLASQGGRVSPRFRTAPAFQPKH